MSETTKKIGITAGSFDLTHSGHYLMFQECRNQCDYLIVCLQTDPTIDRPEKNKPIQSIFERFTQLSACKYIDQIIVYETEADLLSILSSVEFDVRFIGYDWKGKNYTGRELEGMTDKVVYNSRNHKYSTTDLRKRVADAEGKRDKNEIRRN